MPLKIYFASKLRHAHIWRSLCKKWGDKAIVVSSWIDEPNVEAEAHTSPDVLAEIWLRNLSDVAEADWLLVYVDAQDIALRGALVEVGVALANGVPVLACSLNVDNPHDAILGSWQFHPGVRRVKSLESAVAQLEHLMGE